MSRNHLLNEMKLRACNACRQNSLSAKQPGKSLVAQRSLVLADRPTPKTPRSCYARNARNFTYPGWEAIREYRVPHGIELSGKKKPLHQCNEFIVLRGYWESHLEKRKYLMETCVLNWTFLFHSTNLSSSLPPPPSIPWNTNARANWHTHSDTHARTHAHTHAHAHTRTEQHTRTCTFGSGVELHSCSASSKLRKLWLTVRVNCNRKDTLLNCKDTAILQPVFLIVTCWLTHETEF